MLAGRSWWAETGNMLGSGNGLNVPCGYPACQMDDDEVLGCGVEWGFLPLRNKEKQSERGKEREGGRVKEREKHETPELKEKGSGVNGEETERQNLCYGISCRGNDHLF